MEVVLAAVDVGDAQRAAGGLERGGAVAVLGHRAGGRATDGGAVVGAVDGDVDHLGGGAVDRLHRQRVVHHGGGGQRLHIGGAVVERVAPRADGRIEREAAVEAGESRCRNRLEVVLAAVDVGDAQRAAGGLERGGAVAVLGHRAGGRATDGGAVVGAVDGDVDHLGGGPFPYTPLFRSVHHGGGGQRLHIGGAVVERVAP